MRCPSLTQTEYLTISQRPTPDPLGPVLNTVANFSCIDDSHLNGSQQSKCIKDLELNIAQWSHPQPSCTREWHSTHSLISFNPNFLSILEINCGAPPKPQNGQVIAPFYFLGSLAFYFCDPGYQLVAPYSQYNSERQCEVAGWSGPMPICESERKNMMSY